jgi:hypothetical protein
MDCARAFLQTSRFAHVDRRIDRRAIITEYVATLLPANRIVRMPPVTLDANQILALAPDPASAKAGSQLASHGNWSNLCRNDAALWGECQGSGKTPYRTQIDLAGPAFKCSCPSRKFPCKHGLGLYLLLAAQPALFADGAPPPWVSDWLESRQTRQEKKAEKNAASAEQKQQDPVAAVALARKREEQRAAKVDTGIRELQTWLHDLASEGLVAIRARGQGFWEAIAARLADAQAAPLARRLRRAGTMLYQANLPDAEGVVARELASIYLLTRAWQGIDLLPAPLQADVHTLLGWTVTQDEVLTQPAVTDCWRVLAQTVSEDDLLRVRATWLRGASTGRWALLLHYAAGSQGFETAIAPGITFGGDLCFYPGAYPLRAQIRQQGESYAIGDPGPFADLDELLDTHAHALAANPFLERHPALLDGLSADPGRPGELRDRHGRAVALHPAFRHGVQLLAVTGGHPCALVGEWDGRALLPLSLWHEGRLYNIDSDLPI